MMKHVVKQMFEKRQRLNNNEQFSRARFIGFHFFKLGISRKNKFEMNPPLAGSEFPSKCFKSKSFGNEKTFSSIGYTNFIIYFTNLGKLRLNE